MKLAVLAIGLIVVIAGTASASLFVGPSQPNPPASTPAARVAPPQRNVLPRPTPKPQFEIRQAPVPSLRVSARPHFTPKAATPERAVREPAVPEGPKLGEDSARAAILADGYRSVLGLVQNADGQWTARVMRGRTEIEVTVDAEGRVSAD
jgi:hypothetical protein